MSFNFNIILIEYSRINDFMLFIIYDVSWNGCLRIFNLNITRTSRIVNMSTIQMQMKTIQKCKTIRCQCHYQLNNRFKSVCIFWFFFFFFWLIIFISCADRILYWKCEEKKKRRAKRNKDAKKSLCISRPTNLKVNDVKIILKRTIVLMVWHLNYTF